VTASASASQRCFRASAVTLPACPVSARRGANRIRTVAGSAVAARAALAGVIGDDLAIELAYLSVLALVLAAYVWVAAIMARAPEARPALADGIVAPVDAIAGRRTGGWACGPVAAQPRSSASPPRSRRDRRGALAAVIARRRPAAPPGAHHEDVVARARRLHRPSGPVTVTGDQTSRPRRL
jgi:hypothetical protein